MVAVWDPEVEVGEAQVRLLLAGQFPRLGRRSVRHLGDGWDNTAWLVDDRWVFRFPRRRIAAELLANELRGLRRLDGRLPLAIPRPAHVGRPDGPYPYSFAGHRTIRGWTGCQRLLAPGDQERAASALAGFLRALHSVAVTPEDLDEGPHDTLRRADRQYRLPRLVEKAIDVSGRDPSFPSDRLGALLTELLAAPDHSGPLRWVHGDLHPRHVVFGRNGRLRGVIDWGDVHLGDPAGDLSIAFTLFEPEARRCLIETFGETPPGTWQRARFRAVHHAIHLVDYGLSVGDAAMLRVGRHAAAQALLP